MAGRGSSRNQIRKNKVEAQANCKNVGVTDSYNGRQGGPDVSDNTVIAGERCQNIGVHNVGNTTPDEGSSRSRNQIRDEEIILGPDRQNVGPSNLQNVRGQGGGQGGGHDICGNTSTECEGARNVGNNSRRNQFRNNDVGPQANRTNVGITESYNGPGQGGLDVSNNTVIAGERSENVGVHKVGNTRPDEGSSQSKKKGNRR